MDSRPPWLSHNSLRHAYLAFDMDNPAEMPVRPIIQVIKLGASTVTMGNKKQSTVKSPPFPQPTELTGRIQCTDGGLAGQDMGIGFLQRDWRLNLGIMFLQPDMLDSSRASEPDFEVSVGCAVILLEYRVQQSPKTRLYAPHSERELMCRKYLRVSEMLILGSMVHLRSEIPIESRPPVARSQLLHRESVSGDFQEAFGNTVIPSNIVQEASTNAIQGALSTTHQTQEPTQSSHRSRVPFLEESSPNAQHIQSQSQYSYPQHVPPQCPHPKPPSQQQVAPILPRKTSYFGHNPSTPENLIPLSSLPSKNPGETIGSVFFTFPLTKTASP